MGKDFCNIIFGIILFFCLKMPGIFFLLRENPKIVNVIYKVLHGQELPIFD